MSTGSDSLNFIRALFFKDNLYKAPELPIVSSGNYFGQVGSFGFDYGASTMTAVGDMLRLEHDLISRFVDYEDQDDSPLISSALDIYADDATQFDSVHQKSLWVEAEDEDVRGMLDHLFQKTLRVDERVWEDMRTLVKYGNYFAEQVVKDGDGVVALNYLPPPTVRRIEVENAVMGYLYDPKGVFKISTAEFLEGLKRKNDIGAGNEAPKSHSTAVYEGWEMIHMRLRGKNPRSVYGFGVGEPARWLYKRLVLLEDSIILHRLTRAPSRYAFYVDVSQIPPQDTNNYLNRIKQQIKKKKFVNPSTGKLDQRWDVLGSDDDFFLPVRDGKESTRIESLAGPVYDHIEDIKFFENKLFAALKIPKPYMGYEESTAKSHLAAEDARFARTVMRFQREMRNGYKRVANTHLAAKRINPDKVDFDVCMTIPSSIFEIAQLEVRKAELDLAKDLEAYAPKAWIMHHILGFSDDQIEEMEKIRVREREREDDLGPSDDEGQEQAKKKVSSDEFLMGGIKKNTDNLLERIDELRKKNKDFDRKWERTTSFLRDLQTTMGRRR